jgi:hypothetical protein
VGINPHFGSFDRGVSFSNDNMFWYLLSDAGILKEERNELRDDEPINKARIFVGYFPLRGEAIVRTRELKDVLQATLALNKHESC